MQELRNQHFQLVENRNGHVTGNTVMKFSDSIHPCVATYTGPNVVFGQVIVNNGFMLYQAMDTSGLLHAGKAVVTFKMTREKTVDEMILDWQWLTGDQTNGTSRWTNLNLIN